MIYVVAMRHHKSFALDIVSGFVQALCYLQRRVQQYDFVSSVCILAPAGRSISRCRAVGLQMSSGQLHMPDSGMS